MRRFVIEHLPRAGASYAVAPLDHQQARAWMRELPVDSLIRTTELIAAIEVGMGISLTQSEDLMALRAGDEALLITLSFGVLLAWAEGKIPPLPEDWRCLLLRVEDPRIAVPTPALHVALATDVPQATPAADLGLAAAVEE